MKSPYFNVEKVADGVYAAIAIEDRGAWGNAGFVDLGDTTLVFDSMLTPAAASDLRHAAEHFTENQVSHLVNSHYHFDHVFGNQVFQDVTIIATARTQELMVENLDFTNVTSIQNEIRKNNEELSAQIVGERSPWIQRWLQNEIAERQKFIEALPNLQLTLPNQTFVDQLEIQGSKRRIELITYGGGHTDSDAIMYLPDEGIAFMGDLVLVDTHPMLATGNPNEWLAILEKIIALPIQKIIPGHGRVGDSGHAVNMIRYITDVQQLVHDAYADGKSLEILIDSPIPGLYQDWRFAHVFDWNLKYLYKQETQTGNRNMIHGDLS